MNWTSNSIKPNCTIGPEVRLLSLYAVTSEIHDFFLAVFICNDPFEGYWIRFRSLTMQRSNSISSSLLPTPNSDPLPNQCYASTASALNYEAWHLILIYGKAFYHMITRGHLSFLCAFAKLRKTTVSFVMSVRPSVRPHGTIRPPVDGFSWKLIFEYFAKSI